MLSLRELLLDSPDAEPLTVLAEERRVLVLRPPARLTQVLSGARAPRGGRVTRSGPWLAATRIERWPPRMTTSRWLVWRLRLGGLSRGEASVRAERALDRFELTALGGLPVHRGPPWLQRALPIAAALELASREATVVLDDAFTGLDDGSARHLAELFVRHAQHAAWVACVPRAAAGSPLWSAAESHWMWSGGRLERLDPRGVAPSSTYLVQVRGDATVWSACALEAGAELLEERATAVGKLVVLRFDAGRGPGELFALLEPAGDLVIELHPVG